MCLHGEEVLQAQDQRGQRPLHHAAAGASLPSLRWLLSRPAVLGTINHCAVPPLAAQPLRAHSTRARSSRGTMQAVAQPTSDEARALSSAGCGGGTGGELDFECLEENSATVPRTPLWLACSSFNSLRHHRHQSSMELGCVAAVQALLDAGASLRMARLLPRRLRRLDGIAPTVRRLLGEMRPAH